MRALLKTKLLLTMVYTHPRERTSRKQNPEQMVSAWNLGCDSAMLALKPSSRPTLKAPTILDRERLQYGTVRTVQL